jgi:hypothetical protein
MLLRAVSAVSGGFLRFLLGGIVHSSDSYSLNKKDKTRTPYNSN